MCPSDKRRVPNHGRRPCFSTVTSGERISERGLKGVGDASVPAPRAPRPSGIFGGNQSRRFRQPKFMAGDGPGDWPPVHNQIVQPAPPPRQIGGGDPDGRHVGWQKARWVLETWKTYRPSAVPCPTSAQSGQHVVGLDLPPPSESKRTRFSGPNRARCAGETQSRTMPVPLTSYRSIPPSAMYLISR